MVDCHHFGGWTEDAICRGTCKVLGPLDAAIVFSFAYTIACKLEAGVEARLEFDGAEMSKHADEVRAFHANEVANLKLASTSNMFSRARSGGGRGVRGGPADCRWSKAGTSI